MSPCRHHLIAPCCNPVARAAHLSAAPLVNLLGQGRGTHARFRRARPFVPERLRSCRVSRAFAHDRNAPCSVRADTRLALPVSPATHPSSPSRDDGHPPARSCYARNVTTALRGTTRESSDRPLQTNLFKEEDPEPFVDQRCRGFRRIRTDGTHGSRRTHRGSRLRVEARENVSVLTRRAVARPPTLLSSPDLREPGFRPALDCRTT